VMVLKVILTLGGFLVLALLVLTFARLRSDWPVYFLAFGAVVGQCLFPVWLFQGLERMKCIAVISVAAKSLVVACLFIFIKDDADYLYVPLLQSAGFILMGLTGLVIGLRSLSVRPGLPSLGVLLEELGEGDLALLEDLDQGLEANPVLTVLHPAQVGLLDADTRCQLALREVPSLAQIAQSLPDVVPDSGSLLELWRWAHRTLQNAKSSVSVRSPQTIEITGDDGSISGAKGHGHAAVAK